MSLGRLSSVKKGTGGFIAFCLLVADLGAIIASGELQLC